MHKLLVLCSVLLPFSAWSFDDVTHSAVINKVYPTSDGRVVLVFDKDHADCTNGSNPDYYYIEANTELTGVNQEGFDAIFSAALLAASMRTEVAIVFDRTTKYCYVRELSMNF